SRAGAQATATAVGAVQIRLSRLYTQYASGPRSSPQPPIGFAITSCANAKVGCARASVSVRCREAHIAPYVRHDRRNHISISIAGGAARAQLETLAEQSAFVCRSDAARYLPIA